MDSCPTSGFDPVLAAGIPFIQLVTTVSTRIDGTVLVIEARLSVNLNALTIEQAQPPAPCVATLAPPCPPTMRALLIR